VFLIEFEPVSGQSDLLTENVLVAADNLQQGIEKAREIAGLPDRPLRGAGRRLGNPIYL
jgi:hypothetical protein